MCKMICPGVFSFVYNFDFLGCKGGGGEGGSKRTTKNDPQFQKILSVTLHISVTIYTSSRPFLIFSKF